MPTMIKKILLNNSEFLFSIDLLPCLIHGRAHEGSSLFTVTLIASLYKQGYKVLFLSGYPMARQELVNQIEGDRDTYVVDGNLSVDKAINSKMIFIQREYLTVEHILYALLHDAFGVNIIVNCGGNVSRMKAAVEDYFDKKYRPI